MTSPYSKAKELRKKYSEVDAICHATQCLVASPYYNREYWWEVIELVKNYEN